MNGSPRCQNCGSWNTILIPATYGERVMDSIVKGTGLLGAWFAPVLALINNFKIIECKDCKHRWHY